MEETDRLRWWEDIPLALALVAQSYVVGLWYFASIHGADAWVDLVVAIGAGLALDLIVVTTVMGRRAGRSSGWSWATSLGAFVCSSLIALDRYGWEWRSGLHIAFPLVVFLYSQHLATPRKRSAAVPVQAVEEIEEAIGAPVLAQKATAKEPLTPIVVKRQLKRAARLEDAQTQVPQDDPPLDVPLMVGTTPLPTNGTSAYTCPHCNRPLKSKQARGAAAANGYCPACKTERKALAVS